MRDSRSITRSSASNLALAFVLLPRQKRDDMSALYAFCREVDDVADEDAVPAGLRRERLAEWREDIRRACEQGEPRFLVNQELKPVIARWRLPLDLFHDLIAGCEMDLDTRRYATFEDLETYCYHVASVVGLLSIEVFGYTNPACRQYAVSLGKALQLTNILRDVQSDAARGRIYLPLSELERHQVSESEVLEGRYSQRFCSLASAVAERARRHYQQARELLPPEDRRSMIAAELMGSVYWCLLGELGRRQFNVFGPKPARLNKCHKLFLIWRTWFRLATGAAVPNYGAT